MRTRLPAGSGTTSTSTCASGSGWQSGTRSAVRLAAMMPARRATASASPFGSAPAAICASVAGRMRTSPRATASRRVIGFGDTSTMRARPRRSTWLSRRARAIACAAIAAFPGLAPHSMIARHDHPTTTARAPRSHRLRHRPRLHGDVGVLRRARRPRVDRDHPPRARPRRRLPRHRRHVWPLHQRGARRARYPRRARPGRRRHQVRHRARRRPAGARHQRAAGVRARRMRRELEAPRRRDDRPLLPAPGGPEHPDRGHRGCDGRPRARGQGALARPLRGGARDAPPRLRGAPDHRGADRVLALEPRPGGPSPRHLSRARDRLRRLQPARARLPDRADQALRGLRARRLPPPLAPLPGRELPEESRPRAPPRSARGAQGLQALAARARLGARAGRGHRPHPGDQAADVPRGERGRARGHAHAPGPGGDRHGHAARRRRRAPLSRGHAAGGRALGGYPSSHGGCGERSGACERRARSSLLRRAFRHGSSVVAALAALAPRLVRLAHHGYSGSLLAGCPRSTESLYSRRFAMSDANTHRVLILGSGPAGLTAALYAARANLSPTVVEGSQPGGQLTITTDVENYPGFPDGILGPEMMEVFKKQATRFGTRYLYGDATAANLSARPFRLTVDGREHRAETLIIATGATAKLLGLASEKELMGYGVSACATCDVFFFKDKDVVVVGGGDTAMEEANFLSKYATRVRVLHRRDQLRASKIMQDRARRNPKIQFVWNVVVQEVLGEPQNGGVTGVVVEDTRTHERRTLETQGVLVAIGHEPNTKLFAGQLEMDERGYIVTRPRMTETNVPGRLHCSAVQG